MVAFNRGSAAMKEAFMKKRIVFGAPMVGISDKPFRLIVRHFTKAPLYTEMVSARFYRHGMKSALKTMDIKGEKNIIVQLVGSDIPSLIYTAQAAENAGAVGVDINMGCPIRKLVSDGSGAALMKDIDSAFRITEAVAEAVSLPVSVKTRLGWKLPDEIRLLSPRLASAGIARLVVHARTKMQGFTGLPNWRALNGLSCPGVDLIVNGNIDDETSLNEALLLSGAKGAMIGRALWGAPWLLKTLEMGQRSEIPVAETVMEHFERMLLFYGKKGLYASRKHLAHYAKHFVGRQNFCEQMFRAETSDRVRQLIKEFFTRPERGSE